MTADSDALEQELEAHRRRLALLRVRAAEQGISVDPSVTTEIQDIEQRIAAIERRLAGKPASAPSAAPGMPGPLPSAAGDVIIATVGAGAQNVAVGKNIRQGAAEPADDQADVAARLDDLAEALSRLRPGLEPNLAEMAAFQLGLLRAELSKDGEPPSAATITAVGDWLLDRVPGLAAPLAAALTTPALTRRLARAGPAALAWAGRRLAPAP